MSQKLSKSIPRFFVTSCSSPPCVRSAIRNTADPACRGVPRRAPIRPFNCRSHRTCPRLQSLSSSRTGHGLSRERAKFPRCRTAHDAALAPPHIVAHMHKKKSTIPSSSADQPSRSAKLNASEPPAEKTKSCFSSESRSTTLRMSRPGFRFMTASASFACYAAIPARPAHFWLTY